MPTQHLRGTGRSGASLLLMSLAVLAALAGLAYAAGPSKDDPSAQPSEILPRASRSLILDIARAENAFFAVGERGHVLTSSAGRTWKRCRCQRAPPSPLLRQWQRYLAGGHDGVILHSGDGGKTCARSDATRTHSPSGRSRQTARRIKRTGHGHPFPQCQRWHRQWAPTA